MWKSNQVSPQLLVFGFGKQAAAVSISGWVMQLRERTFKIFLSIRERRVCYTCCVLRASCISDAVEDFSTIEPPKCLLIGRLRPWGKGEVASALGQPAENASPLSHPFPRPGSNVGLSSFYSCFWFCGVSNSAAGWVGQWGWGRAQWRLKVRCAEKTGARLAGQGYLPTFQIFGPGIILALRPAQPHLGPLRDPLAHCPSRRWIKQLHCPLFYLQRKRKSNKNLI